MHARTYKYVCIDMYINTCVCAYIHIYLYISYRLLAGGAAAGGTVEGKGWFGGVREELCASH